MNEGQDNNQTDAPKPEALTVQGGDETTESSSGVDHSTGNPEVLRSALNPKKRNTYRPSHKATFIGLSVVALILVANAVGLAFLMKNNADAVDTQAKQGVTLSSEALNKLGVDRNPTGGANTELTIGPATKFTNKVVMGSDVNIAGQLNLNGRFSASDANFAKLQAGDTALGQLNVNGDGTISTLNLRKDLAVVGNSRLQGPVTIGNILTVNNNANIAGSLSIGGALSVREFQVNNLTIGSHIITRGSAPGVSAGGGVGSGGNATISGNDASGTVAVNVGVGSGGGLLATVNFQTRYGTIPHVVVSPVGRAVDSLYITRSSTGFAIYSGSALSPGGYAFDYIVMQ